MCIKFISLWLQFFKKVALLICINGMHSYWLLCGTFMQLVVGYRVFHISKTHAYNIIIRCRWLNNQILPQKVALIGIRRPVFYFIQFGNRLISMAVFLQSYKKTCIYLFFLVFFFYNQKLMPKFAKEKNWTLQTI